MIFRIKETGKQFAVTLKVWDDDLQQWSPDCYDDIGATDWQRFPRYNDDENIRLISQDDFNKLVEWWKDEVEYFNSGNFSEVFGDRDEWIEYHGENYYSFDFWEIE